MNSVGGEPAARLKFDRRARLPANRWLDFIEPKVVAIAEFRGQNPHHPPVIGATHGDKQMKPARPEENVEFVLNHRASHTGVGYEKYVFVGRAGKVNAVETPDCTVRTVATCNPVGPELQA